MDGRVVLVNPSHNRVAVRDRVGHYSVFEVNSRSLPDHGDLISGALDKVGTLKLVNLTKKYLFSATVTHTGEPVAFRTKQMVFETESMRHKG